MLDEIRQLMIKKIREIGFIETIDHKQLFQKEMFVVNELDTEPFPEWNVWYYSANRNEKALSFKIRISKDNIFVNYIPEKNELSEYDIHILF